MFFDNWAELTRIIIIGITAYAGLILLQRISGKRTLSKMNAFDLIVTVALGSTLATALLSEEVTLAGALMAFAVLMGLQFSITWLSPRAGIVRRAVKSEPRLLLFRGEFLGDALKKERVLEAEIRQAARSAGIASLDDIEAVVLETDGSFSVVRGSGKPTSTLADIDLPA